MKLGSALGQSRIYLPRKRMVGALHLQGEAANKPEESASRDQIGKSHGASEP